MSTDVKGWDALLADVRAVADDLFATALVTDRSDVVPASNLDRLAAIGLYGLVAPAVVGGLEAPPGIVHEVIELLSGACLTTTFVWQQHLGASRSCARVPAWGRGLARGEVRSGVAFAHLRRPGPPALTARSGGAGGWVLNGTAPWVTGWGLIDVVHTAAVCVDDPTTIVWTLVDATSAPSLDATRLRLAAVDASATVELRFDEHHVDADRVTVIEPLADWQARDALGLRTNGSQPLGIARRAVELLGEGAGSLPEQVSAVRAALDAATDLPAMAHARAEASLLAVLATQALVAAGGGSSLRLDRQAQRLAREATFVMVQGQTPAIRAAQSAILTG